MRRELLDILRCPYCGGAFDIVPSLYLKKSGDTIQDGVLGCHCCTFPVVDGIPILHLRPAAVAAGEQMRAGRPDLARRALLGLDDESRAVEVERLAASDTATTYRQLVQALGLGLEGGYFLYRFSDPSFVVADALLRAVGTTVLDRGDRAIDICGGSGHLTRSLLDLAFTPPVLADLYFAKLWLARRYTAPGCDPVCCDANGSLPFARGAFRLAICADAFMYVWTKRQCVGEMTRLLDGGDGLGALLITHTHNERQWSPSHGQTLPPEGYRDLFEAMEPGLFAEAGLFEDTVGRGAPDLSRRDTPHALDRDPALDIVASRHPGVFRRHDPTPQPAVRGELRVNPLYVVEREQAGLQLARRFPSAEYEEEFGACRRYLPETLTIEAAAAEDLAAGRLTPTITDLLRRRIVLDLPRGYY